MVLGRTTNVSGKALGVEQRWTNNLEGPAVTVGRAGKSLSMVDAERLASAMELSWRKRENGE